MRISPCCLRDFHLVGYVVSHLRLVRLQSLVDLATDDTDIEPVDTFRVLIEIFVWWQSRQVPEGPYRFMTTVLLQQSPMLSFWCWVPYELDLEPALSQTSKHPHNLLIFSTVKFSSVAS